MSEGGSVPTVKSDAGRGGHGAMRLCPPYEGFWDRWPGQARPWRRRL